MIDRQEARSDVARIDPAAANSDSRPDRTRERTDTERRRQRRPERHTARLARDSESAAEDLLNVTTHRLGNFTGQCLLEKLQLK
jgi:hypothetical protein